MKTLSPLYTKLPECHDEIWSLNIYDAKAIDFLVFLVQGGFLPGNWTEHPFPPRFWIRSWMEPSNFSQFWDIVHAGDQKAVLPIILHWIKSYPWMKHGYILPLPSCLMKQDTPLLPCLMQQDISTSRDDHWAKKLNSFDIFSCNSSGKWKEVFAVQVSSGPVSMYTVLHAIYKEQGALYQRAWYFNKRWSFCII